MEKRIAIYNDVIKHLKDVSPNTCISKKNKSFNNVFYIGKRIGTKSKYGHVYTMADKKATVKIALKVIDDVKQIHTIDGMDSELYVMRKLLSRKGPHIHLPIIYGIYDCRLDKNKDVWIHSVRPSDSSSTDLDSYESTPMKSRYTIILNELADGDLKDIVNTPSVKNNYNTMKSIMFQSVVSIYTYHKLGFIHKDAHYGNFLYHKIPVSKSKKTCICYQYGKKKYYIENCGYVIVIWDFGFSKKGKNDRRDYLRILRILHSFVPAELLSDIKKIPYLDSAIASKNPDLIISEKRLIQDMLDLLTSAEPIGDIIHTVKI